MNPESFGHHSAAPTRRVPGGSGYGGTRRMARPDRRAQLCGAAQAVFVLKGYHAASMDDVAEAAGVSKPVLYQHFSSKLDMYQALVEMAGDEFVGAIRQSLGSADDERHNRSRVRSAIDTYFSFAIDHSGSFRLLFDSALPREPEIDQIIERTTDACAEVIAQIIAANSTEGPAASHLLAATLVGMSVTGATHWLRQPENMSKEQVVDLLARLAWGGISRFGQIAAE